MNESESRSAAYNFELGGDSAAAAWRSLGPKMKAALDAAYDDLLWISEYPNRHPEDDGDAVALAEYARESLSRIERAER